MLLRLGKARIVTSKYLSSDIPISKKALLTEQSSGGEGTAPQRPQHVWQCYAPSQRHLVRLGQNTRSPLHLLLPTDPLNRRPQGLQRHSGDKMGWADSEDRAFPGHTSDLDRPSHSAGRRLGVILVFLTMRSKGQALGTRGDGAGGHVETLADSPAFPALC